jgi:DNA-binding NarL/FixJ family response regulator
MPIRVALVDDHAMLRAGYRYMLAAERDIEIVAEGESGEDALRIVRELKPDVLILDVSMPGLSGVEVTYRLAKMDVPTRVVIVTMHSEGPLPRLLLDAGAAAFLTKGSDATELIDAVRQIMRGQRFVGRAIAQRLALANATGENAPLDRLTARELEVAMMLGRGERPQDIASRMHISDKTVHTYKTRVLSKLEIRTESELTLMLVRFGLLAG